MKRLLLGLFIVMFLIHFISGEIIFNESFEDRYSVGDLIKVNFFVEKQIIVLDYVEVFLVCGGDKELVSKQPLQTEVNKKNYFSFEFPAFLEGDCYLEIQFDGESKKSDDFEISNEIIIDYQINNKIFSPSDEINLFGVAKKGNGDLLNGIIEVFISGVFEKFFDIEGGNFSLVIPVGKEVPPGEYILYIRAVNKNLKEEVINSGEENVEIEIKRIAMSVDILTEEIVSPPKNFSVKANLLDQGGNLIQNESILLKFFSPERDILFEGSVKSGEEIFYFFKENSAKGMWELNAYFGGIFSSKQIYIEENPSILINVVNNSDGSFLLIYNNGNVLYSGVVSFFLNNGTSEEEILINIDLEIGDELRYDLDFEGDYEVVFGEESLGNFYLTGATVGTDLVLNPWSYYLVLVLFLIFGGFYLFKKREEIKSFGRGLFLKKESLVDKKVPFNKKAYICFFAFDKDFSDAEIIIERYGLSFRKVSTGVYFVLIYSTENLSKKFFNLAKEIREKSKLRKINFSIVLNQTNFDNRVSALKQFSSASRKLLSHAKNKLLISKNIFDSLGLDLKNNLVKIRVGEEVFEVYLL